MYPFRQANVPLGVYVPQFGNPWFSSTYVRKQTFSVMGSLSQIKIN